MEISENSYTLKMYIFTVVIVEYNCVYFQFSYYDVPQTEKENFDLERNARLPSLLFTYIFEITSSHNTVNATGVTVAVLTTTIVFRFSATVNVSTM